MDVNFKPNTNLVPINHEFPIIKVKGNGIVLDWTS